MLFILYFNQPRHEIYSSIEHRTTLPIVLDINMQIYDDLRHFRVIYLKVTRHARAEKEQYEQFLMQIYANYSAVDFGLMC